MSNSQTHRVFLLDDHPFIRVGMKQVIDIEPDLKVCGELGTGKGAVSVIQEARPDIVILDMSLPDYSGLEVIKDLRAAGFKAPILVLSMHDETLYAERVVRAGANGYVMKQEATDRVVDAIHILLRGDVYLSEAMCARMLRRMAGGGESERLGSGGPPLERLTDREFEVFELMGHGISTREIAKRLSISPKTVDAHRANIKEKLAMRDINELIRHAVRWVETEGPRAV